MVGGGPAVDALMEETIEWRYAASLPRRGSGGASGRAHGGDGGGAHGSGSPSHGGGWRVWRLWRRTLSLPDAHPGGALPMNVFTAAMLAGR